MVTSFVQFACLTFVQVFARLGSSRPVYEHILILALGLAFCERCTKFAPPMLLSQRSAGVLFGLLLHLVTFCSVGLLSPSPSSAVHPPASSPLLPPHQHVQSQFAAALPPSTSSGFRSPSFSLNILGTTFLSPSTPTSPSASRGNPGPCSTTRMPPATAQLISFPFLFIFHALFGNFLRRTCRKEFCSSWSYCL